VEEDSSNEGGKKVWGKGKQGKIIESEWGAIKQKRGGRGKRKQRA